MEHPADHRYPEMATPCCIACGCPLDRNLPEDVGALCLVCGVLVFRPDTPSELPAALVERLASLDERDVRAFLMRLYDFTDLEIARELGVSPRRSAALVRGVIERLRRGTDGRVPWKPVTW